jgi:hypothetical protein
MYLVDRFLIEKNIDKDWFKDGITHDGIRKLEEQTNIGINVFYIDRDRPHNSRIEYLSIFNNKEHEPVINLGYLKDGDNSHFVLITKRTCVVSEKYYSHKKLICSKCYSIFSDREGLLNHENKEHNDDSEGIQVSLPDKDKASINFDIKRENDLKKTVWY